MRHVISGGLVAAALGAVLIVAGAFPASAQIARPQSALAIDGSNGDLLTLVQDRRGGGGEARSGGGRSGGAALRAGGGGREGARVSRASRGDAVQRSRASRDTRVVRSNTAEHRRWNNNNRRWTNNWRWRNNRYGYGYGYGYPYGYYGYGSGLGFGLALSAPYYASSRYYADGDAVAYCMSRFQSYDPASGTYLGFDGLRHPCP